MNGADRLGEGASCRDKGLGGVDDGALCLSSWGCDRVASRNLDRSSGHQDKHKAPTLLHVHPLSLQDAGRHSPIRLSKIIRVTVQPVKDSSSQLNRA